MLIKQRILVREYLAGSSGSNLQVLISFPGFQKKFQKTYWGKLKFPDRPMFKDWA